MLIQAVLSIAKKKEAQIKGITIIADFQQIRPKVLSQLQRESVKQLFYCFQGRVPIRVAKILILDSFPSIISLFHPFISTKLAHRVTTIKSRYELKQHIKEGQLE
eukprot:c14975_g1_i2.p1 GENE.c14975_g1_i2~~c14975_g1_i2.p1  ORF type:complete len:105 (+),score=35.08 c14975_g1_i2:1261-1575(+)